MYPPSATPAKRLYYLDVIKVFCLSFVFLFHCFKVFDADWWLIKNADLLNVKADYIYEVGLALMPGFFFISGASIWISMQKRSAKVFLQNIFKRFFFPLLFGLTVLAVPQVYFQYVSQGKFSGSFIEFIPTYFNGLRGNGGNFAWWGLHLWFMVLLFLYSILLIPFFSIGKKWLLTPLPQKLLKSLWVLLLFAVVVAAPGYKLHPNGWLGNMWGGWNLVQNLIFLASGFVLFAQPQFLEQCKKHKWLLLTLALVLTTGLVYTYADVKVIGFRSPVYTLRLLERGIACWAWISGVLGIAATYFSDETRFVKYWSVAAMPFYILSQPVIVAISFYVVQWPLSILYKFCIITAASFVITILMYEVIKRSKALRWLFGIPPKSSVARIKGKLPRKLAPVVIYAGKEEKAR
ncbi:MAG: acyltransferase family protein [Chitinophagaceae bacterium]